jgi:hypothetical protein
MGFYFALPAPMSLDHCIRPRFPDMALSATQCHSTLPVIVGAGQAFASAFRSRLPNAFQWDATGSEKTLSAPASACHKPRLGFPHMALGAFECQLFITAPAALRQAFSAVRLGDGASLLQE